MNLTKNENQGQDNKSFTKKTGFFLGSVISINPDEAQIAKILNTEEEKIKPVEYVKETSEDETLVNINFWLKDSNSDFISTYKITLIDKERVGKNSNKPQWVNQCGENSWADDEKDLFQSFTHFTKINNWKTPDGKIVEKYETGAKPNDVEVLGKKEYRKAMVGESDLYDFMKNWLNIDWRNQENSLLVDWKKLMRGNVKELTSLISEDMGEEVIFLAEVIEKEGEEGTKEYQGIYRNTLLGAGYNNKWALLNNAIQTGNFTTDKGIKKFIEDLQGEYGSKNKYSLTLLQDYNKATAVSNEAKAIDPTSSDY